MKTRNDIVDVIKKLNFKWQIDEKNDLVAFEVPIKKRKQSCIAKISKIAQVGDIIEVVSVIGQLDKNNTKKALETMAALLMINLNLVYAKTQVDQKVEKMYIAARSLASSTDEEELKAMIQEVAIYADVLEEKLFGSDTK